MNISSPFIHRPIATTLLAIGLAMAGFVAFIFLPVAPLPDLDFPTMNIQASMPGASPENMATSVATPLERQFGWISGITQMTSTSMMGLTQITIQFDLDRDINGASRDIQAAINAARSQLPPNLPSNPSYKKLNPSESPILILALTSEQASRGEMYDVGSSILQQKLSQISGVGQVLVAGSSLPAVRIDLNPRLLEKYGISLANVASILAAQNVNRPKGQLVIGDKASEIIANDQIFKAEEYQPLIIAYRNKDPVYLADVADVENSVENIRNAGVVNNKPSIFLVIFKQPGANVINTVEEIKKSLPQLIAALPSSIDTKIVMDRTNTIRASLHDVEITLILSMLLVVLVTYLFLGNLPAMLIPGAAVLLSLLGTFAVMSLLHYSLDNLSLMALTISTGFVIDDAIVVLENISRHIEKGVKPFQAALEGAKEVGFTVISMSLSLIAVFTPILLMGGLVGRLFREFAVTLSIAIAISLLVSLTVTPMMCAYMLKPHHFKAIQKETSYHKFISMLHKKYEDSLGWALRHVRLMLFLTLGAVLLNILFFIKIPKGFFPQQDTGRIFASMQADQNSSFQFVDKKLNEYVKLIYEDKAVENVIGYIGNSTANAGVIYISLKELSKRDASSEKIINRLRTKLKTVKGANLYMQSAQDIVIGGRLANGQYQYTLTADKLSDLTRWAPKVMEKLRKMPEIVDLSSDQLNRGLQQFAKIDRDRALSLGFSVKDIDKALALAYGQSQISTFYGLLNQYHVVMEVASPYSAYPSSLISMRMVNEHGKPVPMRNFISFNTDATLLSVNHQGQSPAVTLSFNLRQGHSLGDVVKKITNEVEMMHLPSTIQATFQGTAQAFKSSLSSEPYLILIALLSIYIVLGILYESLIHPITILSTLPSAGVGALLALFLTRTEFSIIAMVGLILLIGIVKKNAIMMIDFALHIEREKNENSRNAIYKAAVLRFRPIMMTTVAAILGALPLAIGFGVGSEFRRPLGIAIIGGLVVSQMLTLYTTPVIYLELEKFSTWYKGLRWNNKGRILHD